MRRPRDERAQSTVEFALVLPLFVGCIAFLLGTTVLCLQYLALHDIARTAARAAVTADDPLSAARATVTDPSVDIAVSEDPNRELITVTAERTGGVWWFSRFLPSPLLAQSVTMMREAPIVLGR